MNDQNNKQKSNKRTNINDDTDAKERESQASDDDNLKSTRKPKISPQSDVASDIPSTSYNSNSTHLSQSSFLSNPAITSNMATNKFQIRELIKKQENNDCNQHQSKHKHQHHKTSTGSTSKKKNQSQSVQMTSSTPKSTSSHASSIQPQNMASNILTSTNKLTNTLPSSSNTLSNTLSNIQITNIPSSNNGPTVSYFISANFLRILYGSNLPQLLLSSSISIVDVLDQINYPRYEIIPFFLSLGEVFDYHIDLIKKLIQLPLPRPDLLTASLALQLFVKGIENEQTQSEPLFGYPKLIKDYFISKGLGFVFVYIDWNQHFDTQQQNAFYEFYLELANEALVTVEYISM